MNLTLEKAIPLWYVLRSDGLYFVVENHIARREVIYEHLLEGGFKEKSLWIQWLDEKGLVVGECSASIFLSEGPEIPQTISHLRVMPNPEDQLGQPLPPPEPPKPLTSFSTGDIVRLKSGGPIMVLGAVLPLLRNPSGVLMVRGREAQVRLVLPEAA